MAVLRLARRLRQERADDELSPSQAGVMAHLDRLGPCTPNELSAAERVAPPSMNRTLNALQLAGYLERTPSGDDRRRVLVSLTDAGRLVVQETRRRRDAWLDRRLAGLDDDERALLAQATAVLRRLSEE